ncbi:MAG TPA: hypothetical protein VES62_07615 [Thermoleophilaceae bacterium]|nr:hypothetical protein [Thermoleophilaceae bacterium]
MISRPHESDSSGIVERQLAERLGTVEKTMQADALTYVGPIAEAGHDILRDSVEALRGRRKPRRLPSPKLVVILETAGGYMESAERMARLFRHHYRRVEFVVPDFAMSAGTVLAMSGDEIHMDYSSILGPIDPQVPRPGGNDFVPALGYLEQFRRLVEKSANNQLTTAELLYMIQSFNPAELYRYEQERELSVELLIEWLVKYKFKNWKTTATHGWPVTRKMRTDRAEQIARMLNETETWHSHGRGIPRETLQRKLKLVIADFGADATLGPAVRDYHRLLRDYMGRLGLTYAWHTREGLHGI